MSPLKEDEESIDVGLKDYNISRRPEVVKRSNKALTEIGEKDHCHEEHNSFHTLSDIDMIENQKVTGYKTLLKK